MRQDIAEEEMCLGIIAATQGGAMRWSGRVMGGLATTVAVVCSLSMTAVPAATAAGRVTLATAAGCPDVLFVGARGSGESGQATHKDPHGLGPTVNSAYSRLYSRISQDRSVQVVSVPYPADNVSVLLDGRSGIRKYFSGLSDGVDWTMSYLTSRAQACPHQQIVLAGFSQGAMVMHRVLHQLAATSADAGILNRLADAILVGDGDQVPNDNQIRFGSAAGNARGIGQADRTVSHSSAAMFPSSIGGRVLSVCNRHDIVCGWTDTNIIKCLVDLLCPIDVATMIRIHLSYPDSQPLLAAADRAAADVLALHYYGGTLRLTGMVGSPVSGSATVIGGVGPLTVFAGTDGTPPPWIGLAASGQTFTVSGTPDTTGSWAFEVVVQDSQNHEVVVPVTVTIAGNSVSLPGGGSIYSVKALTSTNAWAVGYQCVANCDGLAGTVHMLILHWNGKTWSQAASPTQTAADQYELTDVSATSATDAWAAGNWMNGSGTQGGTLLLHWNGSAWSEVANPGGTAPADSLSGVSADSTTDAWAVGSAHTANGYLTLTLHWNGKTWSQVASPNPGGTSADNELSSVAVTSPTNAWAAGQDGQTLLLHWNGTAWSQTTSPNPGGVSASDEFYSVSADSATDAWAAGAWSNPTTQGSLLAHWNGQAWSQVTTPGGNPAIDGLTSVSADSATDAWAAGYTANASPVLLHWKGTAWSRATNPNPGSAGFDSFNGVSADSATDAWAVGQYCTSTSAICNENLDKTYQPLLLHWNGKAWSAS